MALDKTLDPNLAFNAKLGSDEAVKIYLSKKPVASQGQATPEDDDATLPTRKRKRRIMAGGPKFINFYDMGRKWVAGSYQDVDININISYTEGATDAYKPDATPTLAQWEAMTALIMDYDPANIESFHPRIGLEDGKYFDLTLGSAYPTYYPGNHASTSEQWTNRGWKVRQGQLDQIIKFTVGPGKAADDNFNAKGFPLLASGVQLTGTGARKITEFSDYSSPAIVYRPKGGDKIFLMPTMPRPNGYSKFRDNELNYGLPFDTMTDVRGYESYDWSIVPRTPLLDSTSPYYHLDLTTVDWRSFFPGSTPEADYLRAYKIVQFIETFGQNGWFRDNIHTGGSDYTWHTRIGSILDPAFFPSSGPPIVAPYDYILGAAFLFGNSFMSATAPIGTESNKIPVGGLEAVIQQGRRIYYVWRNTA